MKSLEQLTIECLRNDDVRNSYAHSVAFQFARAATNPHRFLGEALHTCDKSVRFHSKTENSVGIKTSKYDTADYLRTEADREAYLKVIEEEKDSPDYEQLKAHADDAVARSRNKYPNTGS